MRKPDLRSKRISIVLIASCWYSKPMNRWHTTFFAIRLAIWPQKNDTTSAPPRSIASVAVPALAINNFAAHLDHSGWLFVAIPDCHPLAAPFILFRLKREGFSDTQVTHKNGELFIRGRR